MSYKTCPGSIREIKENIKICNGLISKLERREKKIELEITSNPDQEVIKLKEEYGRIKGQIPQWKNRRDENIEHLDDMRKVGEASKG